MHIAGANSGPWIARHMRRKAIERPQRTVLCCQHPAVKCGKKDPQTAQDLEDRLDDGGAHMLASHRVQLSAHPPGVRLREVRVVPADMNANVAVGPQFLLTFIGRAQPTGGRPAGAQQ